MAIDLDGIINNWNLTRQHGTKIAELAKDAKVAYIKSDGTPVPPSAQTIADIKTEAGVVIPLFEAALADMKTAYTP